MAGMGAHFTGASSELYVAYRLTQRGYACYHPLMTQSKADLIVDINGRLQRVQVKHASQSSTVGSSGNINPFVQIRLGGSGKPQYKDGEIDIVAMVNGEDVYMLPWDFVKNKTSISFSDGRLEKLKGYLLT